MKNKFRFAAMIFLWCILFSPSWIIAAGLSVILHECAHLVSCRILSIPVLGIRAFPWGVTARAHAIYEPGAQLAVSAAGPMANFFLLFFHPVIASVFSVEAAELFALANLANGLLNLIPALPLDGGIILKAFLCASLGFVRGFRLMLRITALVSVLIIILGLCILKDTGSNFSYIVAGGFMLWNIRHEKNLVLSLRKRILTCEIKSSSRRKRLSAGCREKAIKIIDRISPMYTLTVCVTDCKNIVGYVSQKDIISNVLKNPSITLGECIENF